MSLSSFLHRNSFMLFKAGLNSLNGQCMYIKVTGIPAIESHQISDSGEEDKSMIVSVHSYTIISMTAYVIFITRNQMVWSVVIRVPFHLKVFKTHQHHRQLKLVVKRKAQNCLLCLLRKCFKLVS